MHLLRNVNHRAALLFALIPARLTSAQICADDSSFQFVTTNSGVTVNCAWLNTKNSAKRTSMYCSEPSIMEACSASCGACRAAITCEDTNDFMFELNFFGKSVGCDWFTKRNTAKRTSKYCVESGSFFDDEIADKCVASCGLCKDDAPTAPTAPASGPTSSCQDSTDSFKLDRNGKIKGCGWAAGNPTKRCKRNPTQQECPETCGSCGKTTPSPTQGPTVAPVTAPKTTPAPTQGPTEATVTTPKTTPSPTQGPTAAAATNTCPNGTSPFKITLMNMGLNTAFDAAFASAKAKWESIIKCNVDDYWIGFGSFDWFNGHFSKPFNGGVDGVVIGFSMEYIDGTDGQSNTLGSAGAIHVRGQGGSPISGIMVFDEDNFATMSQNDAEIIILHEMGHILGLVNLGFSACFSSCNSGEFVYGWSSGCSLASDEYNALNLGVGTLKVENDGGGGTMCSHWEEDSFPKSTGSSELMTGFFESGFAQPITRVTIAALDEGIDDYVVDYNAANPYPFTNALAREGVSKVYIPDTTFTIRDRMVELPPPIPSDQSQASYGLARGPAV